MFSTICRSAALLLALFSLGCSETDVTAPRGDVMLESLEFAADEFGVGDPLIIFARTAGDDAAPSQPLTIRTNSGGEWQVSFINLPSGERDPWKHLPDAHLAAVIRLWEDRVVIGFKEADSERGVDELGRNLTSLATIEQMKEWLGQQGVVIWRESTLIPAVDATMDPEPRLVKAIRAHPNIDYLNPDGVIIFEGRSGATPNQLSVLHTMAGKGAANELRSGMDVTAEYRQPDGSLLRATALVR